jgi:hypothetical protein
VMRVVPAARDNVHAPAGGDRFQQAQIAPDVGRPGADGRSIAERVRRTPISSRRLRSGGCSLIAA